MKTQSFWLVNRMFLLKIVLPAMVAMVLFIISLYQIIIPRFESIILDRKREMTRELVSNAWHVADHFYQEAQQQRISDTEAQRAALAQLRHLRYGEEGKDYFWVTDFHPFMLMHPFRKELNGSDLSDFLDSRGKRLFVEIVKTVTDEGEGFVDYTWQWKDDSSRVVPKLSYVKPFHPWGWIIGTGIYIEDVKAEIASLERNIVTISIWITVAIALLLIFMAVQNLRSERQRFLAESELLEAKERYQALVEASTEGLLMLLDGGRKYLNKTLLGMLGYAEYHTAELRIADIFPDLRDQGSGDNDIDVADLAVDTHIETRLKCSDGAYIDVLLATSTIEFFGQKGIVVIVKDISHQKQMVTELDESREKFMALTNRLSIAVFRSKVNNDMSILEANAAASRILGYADPESLQGVALREHFDESHVFSMMTRELTEHGVVTNRIARCRKKDNGSIMLSFSIVLVRDADGEACHCDCLAEDVSEHQRAEKHAESLISDLQTPLLYLNQPVRAFLRPVHVHDMNDSLGKVMRVMDRVKTDVVLLKQESGDVIGMLSAESIRRGLLREGCLADDAAWKAMQSPIPFISASATVYDALDAYFSKGTRHFCVKSDDGGIEGGIDIEDIQRAQLNNHLYFLRRLENTETIAEITHCHEQLQVFVRMLIERGASVRSITRATTIISDAITQRIIDITIEEIGLPPAPFAFIALGSEGRSEQTLSTDQDNAIIHADVEEERVAEVSEYFTKFAEIVCTALNTVGYAFCKGDVMAMNPRWRQPLRVWKDYVHDWVYTAAPRDLLEVNIFFDFRHVYGDEGLTDSLREHVRRMTSGNNAFFVYLTENALRIKPPSWQFKAAEYVDIKSAMLPFIDISRIYALKHKITVTNTTERLQALLDKDVLSASAHRDMHHAYTFLMSLRYAHQARQLARNAQPDNNVHTQELSETDKLILKRVLAQIEHFQTRLSLDFKGIA